MNSNNCCPRNACAGGYGNCLDVKIVNACNANCAFCIEKGGYCPDGKPVKELALETLNSDADTVLILGGEPTLYPHLAEYLFLIRPWKKNIYMTTNGSLLKDGLTEAIAPYLDGINISIHHHQEDRNDEVYNREGFHVSFDALSEAIKTLHANGVTVRINTNLVKGMLDNLDDVNAMVAMARDQLHADEIRFSELQDCDDLWVDSRSVFQGLPEDPYCAGCEQELPQYEGILVRVKMTCGRVSRHRPPVTSKPKRTGRTEVLYPDAVRRMGWLSSRMDGCHDTDGCHPRAFSIGSSGCH